MCKTCMDSEGYVKDGHMKCYGCQEELKYKAQEELKHEVVKENNEKELTPREARKKAKAQYKKEYKLIRPLVLERDGNKCARCGADNKKLHVHHVKRKSKGGTNSMDNLITLCSKCHKQEHANERVFLIMGD